MALGRAPRGAHSGGDVRAWDEWCARQWCGEIYRQ